HLQRHEPEGAELAHLAGHLGANPGRERRSFHQGRHGAGGYRANSWSSASLCVPSSSTEIEPRPRRPTSSPVPESGTTEAALTPPAAETVPWCASTKEPERSPSRPATRSSAR